MVADLTARAQRRFFIHDDGREMFEHRLDQYSVSVKEVTDAIIQANADLYAQWKAAQNSVTIDRATFEAMKAELEALRAAKPKRGPGRPKKDDSE